MVKKLIAGIFCTVAAFAGQTATSDGQIGVQIALTGAPPAATVSCTSNSGAATGSASVQVTCTSNIYVNIVQFSQSRESIRSAVGEFIIGFGLARSGTSLERVAGQIYDEVAQDDQGWSFEGRAYAGTETPEQAKRLAKQRLRNSEGTLIALSVTGDNGQSGTVEMLVSF